MQGNDTHVESTQRCSLLQCPICSRGGFKRLTRHLSQVHGLTPHGRVVVVPVIPTWD